MVWLVFSGYVVGAVALASLVVATEFRHRVSTRVQRVARAFARQSRGVSARVQGTAGMTGSATAVTLTGAWFALRRPWVWWLA
ncbi:MAG TPA: hypothetical protein VFR86_22330 [Burkholderiaceae bacterium]|nr:hypothetical protein [Burkholderiaceae bacterium]